LKVFAITGFGLITVINPAQTFYYLNLTEPKNK